MKIRSTIATLVATGLMATGVTLGVAGCGQPAPVDYPAPTTWTVVYQNQSYCGYQYDAHEVDMYGNLVCTRVRYPSYTDAVIAGTLAAAMLAYLQTYDGFYHSGMWYDRFYAPLGPRYHVTVIQKNTFISNSTSFDNRYASQIKTNSAKANWTGGKTGNYKFPSSNAKGKTGPLTNTNISTNSAAGSDSRTSTGKTGSGSTGTTSTGKTGTTSRVGGSFGRRGGR